jgi:hypothetical protein
LRRTGLIILAAVAALSGCAPEPSPAERKYADQTKEPWYAQTVNELSALNRQAESAFQAGKLDDASNLILKGEPLANRLVAVTHPSLAAVEAASDLDQLYGQMLLTNKNYGWARLQFQKNRARWKSWQPQTEETARRLKQAEDAIAECDRRMTE